MQYVCLVALHLLRRDTPIGYRKYHDRRPIVIKAEREEMEATKDICKGTCKHHSPSRVREPIG